MLNLSKQIQTLYHTLIQTKNTLLKTSCSAILERLKVTFEQTNQYTGNSIEFNVSIQEQNTSSASISFVNKSYPQQTACVNTKIIAKDIDVDDYVSLFDEKVK